MALRCDPQEAVTPFASVETSVPFLPSQWPWLHTCVAISCNNSRISSVVNGVKVLNTTFPKSTNCPTSLNGNLVLQKGVTLTSDYWIQNPGLVTNVNIFSGLMDIDGMVARTSGKDCGKQDGDLLSWTNSSWTLHGAARWTEVSVEDLCREFSSIQLFSTQRVTKSDDCKRLCENLHQQGRMTSVATPELLERLQRRLGMLAKKLNPEGGNPLVVWVPVSPQNGVWLDNYTNKTISSWDQGYPLNESKRDCGIASPNGRIWNWPCTHTAYPGGWYCSCDFPEHIHSNSRCPSCLGHYKFVSHFPSNFRIFTVVRDRHFSLATLAYICSSVIGFRLVDFISEKNIVGFQIRHLWLR